MRLTLTTKKLLHANMTEVPPQLPWHSPDYFSLNRKLLTVFPGIFRILYLQEKSQLLFQSIMFFPTKPIVANYECCKQDRNQIPNYSRLIQNRQGFEGEKKKAKLATYCEAMLESLNPKQY